MSSCDLLRDLERKSSDSYCCVYHRVIVEKGDGTIKATRGVKERVLANDKNHRDLCPQVELDKCPT
jgi:hypothetical protein